MVETRQADQVVGREVGRTDRNDLRIAGKAIDISPGAACAIAWHVDDADRYVEQPVLSNNLDQSARDSI
jgi:hypothetical protein